MNVLYKYSQHRQIFIKHQDIERNIVNTDQQLIKRKKIRHFRPTLSSALEIVSQY